VSRKVVFDEHIGILALTFLSTFYMADLVGIATLLVLFGGPFLLCANICDRRNRDPIKGLVVALFTGWLGVLCLWLGLKRRNPKTKMLY
jgi:hypothetical protein